MIYLFIKSKP